MFSSWYSRLSLQWKLQAAFGALCAVVVVVGFLGISAVRSVGSDLNEVGTNTIPSIMALNDVRSLMTRVQRDIRQVILSDDKKEIETLVTTINTNLKDIDVAWARYKSLPLTDAERQSAAQVDKDFGPWRAQITQAASLAAQDSETDNAQAFKLAI